MAHKKQQNDIGKALAVVGVAAAAAAGYHFLKGTEGEKNRRKLKGWMLKLRGEVMEKLEKRERVNEEKYKKIVDEVTAKYSKMKAVSTTEARELGNELKQHWKNIASEAEVEIDDSKKKLRGAAGRAVKNARTKAAKKIAPQ